ncbi:hypothetical protein FB45DRAFT_863113 [Roridomyces roridus]|uniref:Uncharacterized protein n=1 Tax=Roridomyces roridus TaxID=1738132 RepID=A0AAD7C8W3_9AGAR|nr:hypothetical protein FB45DRAFT_863113 [Roridomyces roridus]
MQSSVSFAWDIRMAHRKPINERSISILIFRDYSCPRNEVLGDALDMKDDTGRKMASCFCMRRVLHIERVSCFSFVMMNEGVYSFDPDYFTPVTEFTNVRGHTIAVSEQVEALAQAQSIVQVLSSKPSRFFAVKPHCRLCGHTGQRVVRDGHNSHAASPAATEHGDVPAVADSLARGVWCARALVWLAVVSGWFLDGPSDEGNERVRATRTFRSMVKHYEIAVSLTVTDRRARRRELDRDSTEVQAACSDRLLGV